MNNELKNQIDNMIANCRGELIDTYLFSDCGIKEFVAYAIERFSTEMQEFVTGLDSENTWEDNGE